jgi:hypothetical protein
LFSSTLDLNPITLKEKVSAGMAEKARGGNLLLVLPYCKKFSAMAAEKYGFQFVNLLIFEFQCS